MKANIINKDRDPERVEIVYHIKDKVYSFYDRQKLIARGATPQHLALAKNIIRMHPSQKFEEKNQGNLKIVTLL